MKRYDATFQGDALIAVINDNSAGVVEMTIYLVRDGREPETVHIGCFDDYESAENEMRQIFPNVNWR